MEQGLTIHEVAERKKKYGKNVIESNQSFSVRELFLSQFLNVINGILFIAAILSLLLRNYFDSVFILAIIIINAIFGFFQEYRAQKSLEKLQNYTAPSARVIRGGKEQKILASELVPDDIAVIGEGGRIPADGELIEVHHLEVDESVLTGESLPVIKAQKEEVFLGTLVTKGNGLFRIKAIGANTHFGQIAHTLTTIPPSKIPLVENMNSLGKTLSYLALISGFLIIPIGIFQNQSLIPIILVGASIAIAAIPEGLPAVVTIALGLGTHRMAKQGAVVRKMPVIETLGAVQYVLVDKTGTLTQNAMRVRKYWSPDKKLLDNLVEGCVLGNTAALVRKGNGKEYEVVGDRTDGALLLWSKEFPNVSIPDDERIIDEYVFDSKTKTITTVCKQKNKTYVFVRGAPEVILQKSILTESEKKEAVSHFEKMAKEGLRIIGFGVKTQKHPGHLARSHLERDLTFLGIVGLYDPPRPEVKDAVQKAHRAGVQVIMVTGDNELTAVSLAKEVGIVDKNDDVVTGQQLRSLTDDDLSEVLTKIRVFARTRPEEKLRLVRLLQKQGLVVGVTGDGVNDSLALEQANVGIAMGEGGTDVAKEASDIVLTDDNFATLIRAIEEGRIIYKSILNAILYLLSGNLAELSLVLLAVLFRLPFPFVPTQILWINLVTDSLPALALAIGSKDESVLRKKPRDPNMPILTPKRIFLICVIGLSLSLFLLFLFSYLLGTTTQSVARSTVFNLLIYFHLLIAMVIGRYSLARGNIVLVLTIVFIFLLQLFVDSSPFFRTLFLLN